MHLSSQLTYERRAVLVGLFEQGFGYRGLARQVGVGLESVGSLYRRWRIRGTVGLVRKPEASWVLFLPVLRGLRYGQSGIRRSLRIGRCVCS